MRQRLLSDRATRLLVLAIPLLLCLASCEAVRTTSRAAPTRPRFVRLFDGASLDGWAGDPALWSVQEGVIVGRTTLETAIGSNSFLVWQDGTVDDFELHADVRLLGDNNSGIQYRATISDGFRARGYQCDIHPNPAYNAMLYEEGGRGIVVTHGSRIRIEPDGSRTELEREVAPLPVVLDEWHTYTVIARDSRLEHRIDGHTTVIVDDLETGQGSRAGAIALQLHVGAPYEVHFRNIRMRRLD